MHPNLFYTLLGGDDDNPTLELWNCISNKCLVKIDDVHGYRVSTLRVVKQFYVDNTNRYYVTSGSAEGDIKLW